VSVASPSEHGDGLGASLAPAPAAGPAAAKHVLAVCDLSRGGRAALRWAGDTARACQAPLTVVELMRHERSDVGCGICRQGAALWNQRLDEIASERLTQAQQVVGDGLRLGFEVAEQPALSALAQVAARVGADLIALPRHGLGWRRAPGEAARLRQLGEWRVTLVP